MADITSSHLGTTKEPYRRLWCELTTKCQLECVMCYNDSGPHRGHDAMTSKDWLNVIDQAAALRIRMAQFIGGEPTLHPGFTRIMAHALNMGLDVEVYSNLVHITTEMWDLFQSPRVSLAFSYFASDPAAHNAVTRRPSHAATRRNAETAARLGIPIRAGVIDFGHTRGALADLKSIGITMTSSDRVRRIGRGGSGTPAPSELCGHCGQDAVAVGADGDISPCVFTRWLTAGNVRDTSLADILGGPGMATALAAIPARSLRSRGSEDSDDNDGSYQPIEACSPDQPTSDPSCNPDSPTSPAPTCNPYERGSW